MNYWVSTQCGIEASSRFITSNSRRYCDPSCLLVGSLVCSLTSRSRGNCGVISWAYRHSGPAAWQAHAKDVCTNISGEGNTAGGRRRASAADWWLLFQNTFLLLACYVPTVAKSI